MDEDQTRERDSRVGHASSSSSSSSACVLVKVVVLHTPHPPPSVGNSPFCQALCWTTCSQQHSTPPPFHVAFLILMLLTVLLIRLLAYSYFLFKAPHMQRLEDVKQGTL